MSSDLAFLDSNILAAPTPEWQEGLIRRLTGGAVPTYASHSPASIAASRSPISDSSSSHHGMEEPRTRRRLEGTYVPTSALGQQSMNEPYSGSSTSYSNWDEVDDTVDSFGHLALDDMKEVRLLHMNPTYIHSSTIADVDSLPWTRIWSAATSTQRPSEGSEQS